MTLAPLDRADAGWWDTATGAIADGWNRFVAWLPEAGVTAGKIAVTLGVAFVIWFIGRMAIRTATRSIREGITRSERRARRVLRRTGVAVAEPSLEDRQEEKRRAQRAKTISSVLRSSLTVVVVVITGVTVLSLVGINVAPLLAAAGIVGVALGFGAQSVVKDLLTGLLMLGEDQYGVGDVIDVGDATGVVEQVGLRSTRLRSLDGTVWFVPNGEIRRVGNMSRLWSRALIEVRIDYSQDPESAREAMLQAAEDAIADEEISASVLDEPSVPGLESLAADAIVLRLLVQVQPGQQWAVQRAIRREIQRVFRQRGIRMAVPENRVYSFDGEVPPAPPAKPRTPAKPTTAAKPRKPPAKPGSSRS